MLAAALEIVGQRVGHSAIGFLDFDDLPRRGALCGETRSRGLDADAQFEQRHQEFLIGRRIRHPSEHVRIENVPAFLRPDDGATARARFNKPLGGERAQPLAQRRPAHPELSPKLRLGR